MTALPKLLKGLVDLDGFEPSTSSMPWKRAPNCATGPSLRQTGKARIEKLDLGQIRLQEATLAESAPESRVRT